MFFPFYFDIRYLLFSLPALLLALFAQWRVQSAYGKYSRVRNMRNISGLEASASQRASALMSGASAWLAQKLVTCEVSRIMTALTFSGATGPSVLKQAWMALRSLGMRIGIKALRSDRLVRALIRVFS